MIEDGHSFKKISLDLKISTDELKEIVNKNSFALKKEKFIKTTDKIIGMEDYVCKLYVEGVSVKQLGLKFSIDKRRVLAWAEERNILRDKSEIGRFRKLDEHVFDVIDTREKAYWLGYLYAHSYNSGIKLNISEGAKDIDHLEKLSKFLKTDSIITSIKSEVNDYYILSINSKYLCAQLSKLGCTKQKGTIKTYPEWLNAEYDNTFILGMYDGSGSIGFKEKQREWKLSITSTKEICDEVNNKIATNTERVMGCKKMTVSNKPNSFELACGGNAQIKDILTWLYKDSTDDIRLSRKFNKYLQLLDQQNSRKATNLHYYD